MNTLIADTGPIVALWDSSDQYHPWALESLKDFVGPLHTCEAVLTEAFFLLARVPKGCRHLIATLRKRDVIKLLWGFENNKDAVLNLLEKYQDAPVSLADACLVSMAEAVKNPVIWTTDSHFKIYRLRNGKRIPLIIPN